MTVRATTGTCVSRNEWVEGYRNPVRNNANERFPMATNVSSTRIALAEIVTSLPRREPREDERILHRISASHEAT
jgi:hypothetical protein